MSFWAKKKVKERVMWLRLWCHNYLQLTRETSWPGFNFIPSHEVEKTESTDSSLENRGEIILGNMTKCFRWQKFMYQGENVMKKFLAIEEILNTLFREERRGRVYTQLILLRPCTYDDWFKGTLPVLRQFLTAESPLKMMKIFFFDFTLKAFFVLKTFWSCRKTAWLQR